MSFAQFLHQGPRPTNTLGGLRLPTGTQNVGLSHTSPRQLDTIVSVGDNLHWRSSKSEADASNERQPKRQKREPQRTSQHSPYILHESEDEDPSITDDIVEIRHISAASRNAQLAETQSFNSQKSVKPPTQNGRWTAGATEYESLEKSIRCSQPNHKKRRDARKRRARDSSDTPRSSITSSYADPLESLKLEMLVNATVKPPCQGTTNLQAPSHPHVAHGRQSGCGTGYRSRHFAMPDTITPTQEPKSAKSFADGGSISADIQLRNSYRDTDGRRRGSLDHSSSDELVAAEPNSRALSPLKTAQSQTPAQPSQQGLPSPNVIADDSFDAQQTVSNIRPAAFTQPVNHGARPSAHPSNILEENPAPWAIEVRAYYFQGRVHQGDGLGLVYNDKAKCFDIHQAGQSLAKNNHELRIQLAKLQKIFFTLEGTKMRFLSSKVGTADTMLDIDLRHEKDAQQFIKKIQEGGSLFVKGESKDKMDKLFDHRLETLRKDMASGRHLPPKHPDDLVLAGVRIERADNKRDAEELRQDKSKRRRIVDGLGFEGRSGNHNQPRFRTPTTIDTTPKGRNSDAQAQSTTPDELHLTPTEESFDKYQLRSIRASARSKPIDVPSKGFAPEIQKYSRTHEMGKQWAKPLVYPKDGRKRTTVEWSDIERLDEGEFLNDNLVAFYLRYLEHQAERIDPALSRKVYVFNTFFYERLTDTKPRHKGINYDAVRKWTRGVDLFTYDFVVVPVNEAYHWYIAIICNLPALNRGLGVFEADVGQDDRHEILFSPCPPRVSDDANDAAKEHEAAASFAELSLDPNRSADQDALDEQLRDLARDSDDVMVQKAHDARETDEIHGEVVDMEETSAQKQRKGKRKFGPSPRTFDPFKPTILTFDSLGTTHSTAIKMLKQYLHEEAKDKRGQMQVDEKDLQGVTAKDIPQQSNYYDCGLYILGYMEKFFADPRDFVNKVMRKEWDVKLDWPKLDPSMMRTNMRDLLKELYEDQHQESLKVKRTKVKSKSPNGPSSSPSTKRRPPSPEVGGQAQSDEISAKTGPKEDVSMGTSIPDPTLSTGSIQRDRLNAGIKSSREEMGGKASPPKAASSLASHEEHPQSFIALDSQSQPSDMVPSPRDPDLPDPLAISPQLPSTIPDSQAQVPDSALDDELRQISSTTSPPKKPPRRMDSFSSPIPTPKDETKFPPLDRKQRRPISAEQTTPKTRGAKKSSGGKGRPVIIETDPKVIINID